jgi:carbamoyl-phosphate synthase small subunit
VNPPITKTHQPPRHGRPAGGDFFSLKPAKLVLSAAVTFRGQIPEGQRDSAPGEVVFTTGMTGYIETLTDPSYAGQIICFTYPLIGNYGVPSPEFWESHRIHATGVVLDGASVRYSHATALTSLPEWLRLQNVPVLTGVDTRALTKYLRARGTMPGLITTGPAQSVAPTQSPRPGITHTEIINPSGSRTVLLVDCGLKNNLIRQLVALNVRIKRVPFDYDYSGDTFDGLFLSNGPGDPADYAQTIRYLTPWLSRDIPIFGICLGAQLLARATGAKTYKLPFGHRGQNQPVTNSRNQAFITSQNHGYAIDRQSLPKDWHVTFTNLNDGSVEGLAHKSKPFSAVQFHPEAAPGPTDTAHLFADFARSL